MSRKKKRQIRTPVFLQNLSDSPEGAWPQQALYHGTRVALLVLLAVAITLLFPSEVLRSVDPFQEGTVAAEDVAAEVGFDVPKDSVDLEREREEAAASVPPVFTYDPDTQSRVETRLNGFFDRISQAVESGGRTAVEAVLEDGDLPGMVENVEYFLNPIERQALRQATLNAVRQLTGRFLASDVEDAVLRAGQIEVWEGGTPRIQPADGLLWGTAFFQQAVEALEPSTTEFQSTFRLLLIHFRESPYVEDLTRTAADRAEHRSAVPATDGSVVAGEFIVRRGDQIGPVQLRRLNAHREALQSQGQIQEPGRDWGSVLGSFLLNLALLSIFGVLLFFYRPEVYGSFRWVLLLSFLVLAYFLAAAGISWQGYPWELLPIAFVVLPVAILWEGRMALILALVLGVLSGAQGPFNDYPILAFTIIGGAAAALSARAVRRRSQTWIFISLITLGYALAGTALGILEDWEPGVILLSILFGGLNATVSAILAMGFMPVFEWFTGITTDQTLLEWADPNRPLLKSLSLEASGTYAHTINVANLAEASATAIGANGLLARVGIYYHDVGKMIKPQYFVENQPGGRNPHDKLKPHTSATIVREHVIEGERMAREEGVPDVVARFIPEHHGTQLIGFFYEKAKEEAGEDLNENDFRYPGPKPQSKETAIAMLADSVESATRALQDPSPERVEDLVKSIVDGKIRDGQLSEAPLTLRELTLIQEQFVKVVGGMFHHRLDYPATKHLTDAPKDDPAAPSEGGNVGPEGGTEEMEGHVQEQESTQEEDAGVPYAAPREEQLPLTRADEIPPSPGKNDD